MCSAVKSTRSKSFIDLFTPGCNAFTCCYRTTACNPSFQNDEYEFNLSQMFFDTPCAQCRNLGTLFRMKDIATGCTVQSTACISSSPSPGTINSLCATEGDVPIQVRPVWIIACTVCVSVCEWTSETCYSRCASRIDERIFFSSPLMIIIPNPRLGWLPSDLSCRSASNAQCQLLCSLAPPASLPPLAVAFSFTVDFDSCVTAETRLCTGMTKQIYWIYVLEASSVKLPPWALRQFHRISSVRIRLRSS